MDIGKLIGGILCLAAAGLLGLAWYMLPEGDVTFMINGQNVVWVPILVLAGLGVAMLSTVRSRKDA
jgi:hypothetical protein